MNIFVLDESPRLAAEYHCDRHVPKMLLEAAQMLSDAHHFYDPSTTLSIYDRLNWSRNHPCTKWVRESGGNYAWLWALGKELSEEYTLRFNRKHAASKLIDGPLRVVPRGLNMSTPRTPFVQVVPDQYKSATAVEAYRLYYAGNKLIFAKWQRGNRSTPYWMQSALTEAVKR